MCLLCLRSRFLLFVLKCHYIILSFPNIELFIHFTASLTAGRRMYKIYPFCQRQRLASKPYLSFYSKSTKFTQFSIPNTPRHLNTLCYSSEYLLIVSVNNHYLPVYIQVMVQLSAYQFQYTSKYRLTYLANHYVCKINIHSNFTVH